MRPRFEVGDRVCEKLPTGMAKMRTIRRIYEFNGEYRYVLEFDDDSESLFFEFELEFGGD